MRKRKISDSSESFDSNEINLHVGTRIRTRRTLMGMSQARLGVIVGLTFQQIQKYENGATSISVSRLWDLARALEVPMTFFYEEAPAHLAGLIQSSLMERDEVTPEPLKHRETLELVKAFNRIANPALRKNMLDLIRATGNGPEAAALGS